MRFEDAQSLAHNSTNGLNTQTKTNKQKRYYLISNFNVKNEQEC